MFKMTFKVLIVFALVAQTAYAAPSFSQIFLTIVDNTNTNSGKVEYNFTSIYPMTPANFVGNVTFAYNTIQNPPCCGHPYATCSAPITNAAALTSTILCFSNGNYINDFNVANNNYYKCGNIKGDLNPVFNYFSCNSRLVVYGSPQMPGTCS